SWRLAALVFVTLSAALVGGVLLAGLGGTSMSLMALTGLLAVFGIAVRNAIDLLRHVQQLDTETNEQPWSVMLRGAVDRLVPILSSAFVAVGALLPFVLARNIAGLELLHPIASIIVGGIVAATIFTLFVLPVMCASVRFAAEPDPMLE